MNEFKSIAQPICNNQALSTSATDNLSAKIDNLLEIILNDNLELAKRLHEHVPAVEVRSEGPPKCINNLKCSIEKIKVSNGQLASNHVLVGTTMLQKSSAMIATFSNWVLLENLLHLTKISLHVPSSAGNNNAIQAFVVV